MSPDIIYLHILCIYTRIIISCIYDIRSISPSSSNTDVSISPGCEEYNHLTCRTETEITTFEKWKCLSNPYTKYPPPNQNMSAFHHPHYAGNSQVFSMNYLKKKEEIF